MIDKTHDFLISIGIGADDPRYEGNYDLLKAVEKSGSKRGVMQDIADMASHLAMRVQHGEVVPAVEWAELENKIKETRAKKKPRTRKVISQLAWNTEDPSRDCGEDFNKMETLPLIKKCTRGFKAPAFYLFAADPNIGKTAILIQVTIDILKNNPEQKVLFYSADDIEEDILKRMIACFSFILHGENGVEINYTDRYYTHWSYNNMRSEYCRNRALSRAMAYAGIDEWISSGRLNLLCERATMLDLSDKVKETKAGFLIADACYEIQVDPRLHDIQKDEVRAQGLKDIALENKIAVVGAKDARKTASRSEKEKEKGQTSFLSLHDLSGSKAWSYKPNFVATIYLREEGVAVLNVNKNKINKHKGGCLLKMNGAFNAVQEMIEDPIYKV